MTNHDFGDHDICCGQALSQAQFLIYLLQQHQATVRADKATVKLGNNVLSTKDSQLQARNTLCHLRRGLPKRLC